VGANRRPNATVASRQSVGDALNVDVPMLSIVVPVKNEERGVAPFIDRVGPILEKVANGEGWEILFIDDGSSDATLPAIVAAHSRDSRIRAIVDAGSDPANGCCPDTSS